MRNIFVSTRAAAAAAVAAAAVAAVANARARFWTAIVEVVRGLCSRALVRARAQFLMIALIAGDKWNEPNRALASS